MLIISSSLRIVFGLLVLASTAALAQTQAQIQACVNSLTLTSYESPVTYSTADTTDYYTATYSYNPTLCSSSGGTQIPVTKIYLTNQDAGTSTNCALVQFDSSGVLTSKCTQTLYVLLGPCPA